MNSHSPQSPQLIDRFLLLFAILLGCVLWKCLSEMERNAILSRMSDTTPGKLGADFYFKMIGLGGIPALGLLASAFPSISSFLFSWVEPALDSLH